MIRSCRTWPPVRSWAVWLTLQAACVWAADPEQALWSLWEQHLENPANHAAHVEACRLYAAEHAASPLVSVAHTLAAWHLLHLGHENTARQLLEPYAEARDDAIRRGARLQARSWLTRLDREEVKRALQRYYRQEVRFPERLRDIAAHPRLASAPAFPPVDRWGRPWDYATLAPASMPQAVGQRYRLESTTLGALSDLDRALREPYAGGLRLQPVRVVGAGSAEPLVQFDRRTDAGTADEGLALTLGRELEGFYLAHVGRSLILVGDREHWRLFRIPGS